MSFNIKEYNIEIELLSGLHIGGGDTGMGIGGVDNEVIKHPITKLPYIPGSSIKGKMRSLMEYEAGIKGISRNGAPFSQKDYNDQHDENGNVKKKIATILKLFGKGGERTKSDMDFGITRLSFADALPIVTDNKVQLTEVKAENSINRISGTAANPRFIERVYSGVKFKAVISMRLFEGDSEDEFCNALARGLWLLTKDSLGGSGSRGYGRIKLTIDDEVLKDKFTKQQ